MHADRIPLGTSSTKYPYHQHPTLNNRHAANDKIDVRRRNPVGPFQRTGPSLEVIPPGSAYQNRYAANEGYGLREGYRSGYP